MRCSGFEPLDGRSYSYGDVNSYLRALEQAASGYDHWSSRLKTAEQDLDAIRMEQARFKKELEKLLMEAPNYVGKLK